MADKKNAAREAKHGLKMIEVRLRFWTDDLAEKGKVIPKHAWACGMAYMQPNAAHSLKPERPRPFNSLLNIGAAIERVLLDNGIMLHTDSKMQKYLSVGIKYSAKKKKKG